MVTLKPEYLTSTTKLIAVQVQPRRALIFFFSQITSSLFSGITA